jgi:hypothetical protein
MQLLMDMRERLVKIETMLTGNQENVSRLEKRMDSLEAGQLSLRQEATRSSTMWAMAITFGGFLLTMAIKLFWDD